MNKTELILSIAEETGFSRKNVEIALNAAIARITKALTEEEKVQIVGFGYKKIGFILDRGYFSKANIQFMDSCDYDFVMMVKGRASFVHGLAMEPHPEQTKIA